MKFDRYIGFDLHQATTVVAVLDAEGKVVMETIVATEAAADLHFTANATILLSLIRSIRSKPSCRNSRPPQRYCCFLFR
jgi:hypothetical protein